MALTKTQVLTNADKRRVASATLDEILVEVGDGLLTEDELSGLEGGLGRCFQLALDMGCGEKPLVEWSRQEIVRFLAVAVRAAVPLRVVSGTLATNDGIPF